MKKAAEPKKPRENPILARHPMRNAAPVASLLESRRSDTATKLPTEALVLSGRNPRKHFSTKGLAALSASIKEKGILQPLLVRPLGDERFEVVAGERRYRVAVALGLTEVPVVVREMDALEAAVVTAVENLQREDLNPYEQTTAYIQVLGATLGTPEEEVPRVLERLLQQVKRAAKAAEAVELDPQVAIVESVFKEMGQMSWRSFVANRLPLLKLPPEVQGPLLQGHLDYSKAVLLGRVKDAELRAELLREATLGGLSVSALRRRVQSESPSSPLSKRIVRLAKAVGTLGPEDQAAVMGLLSEVEKAIKK